MDAEIAKAIGIVERFFQDPVQRQIYLERERRRLDRLSNERFYKQQIEEAEQKAEDAEERAQQTEGKAVVAMLKFQPVSAVAILLDKPVDYVKALAKKYGVEAAGF